MLNEDQELLREFLLESTEILADFESEMVELERQPDNASLLGSIFRRIHTVKGTCGFFGFARIESISHTAETLLSRMRAGETRLTPRAGNAILKSVDAIRQELAVIEATGAESAANYADLLRLFDGLNQAERPHVGGETEDVPDAFAPPTAATDPLPLEPPSAGNAVPAKALVADSVVRVDVAVLDQLMNLVGELVLTRNQILQKESEKGRLRPDPALHRLNLLTGELQDAVTRTRMQPVAGAWNKLPRMVRDLCSSLGKDIELQTSGGDTELDRGVLEAIRDPLTHMVRNSCDHGIEKPEVRLAKGKPAKGILRVRASQQGGSVLIEISDDGAGMDPGRLKAKALEKALLSETAAGRLSDRECFELIFLPGFSTAAAVTHVSGRGVGMDVVRRNLERIGGVVEVSSRVGEGSQFKIRIPLTVAILPALAMTSGGATFLAPQRHIRNLLRLPAAGAPNLAWVNGAAVLRDRGYLLPLVFLEQVLYPNRPFVPPARGQVVVIHAEGLLYGLVVDRVTAIREIVVKPFGRELAGLPAYAGATILGDGRVALVLDVQGLANLAGLQPGHETEAEPAGAPKPHGVRQTLLLFAAGPCRRAAVPLSLIERLEKLPGTRIEYSAGKPVTQYRGRVLPLLPLAALFEPDRRGEILDREFHPALIVEQSGRRIGVLVDRILDIVDGELGARGQPGGKYMLGSAAVNGQVTDLFNLAEAIQAVDPGFFKQRARQRTTGKRILLAAQSRFDRAVLRSYFELAGHDVVEARDVAEAVKLASAQPIHVLCYQAAPEDAEKAIRLWREQGPAGAPVIGIQETAAILHDALPLEEFDETCEMFDRKALLAAVDKLFVRQG